jgi:hypothetical protein
MLYTVNLPNLLTFSSLSVAAPPVLYFPKLRNLDLLV